MKRTVILFAIFIGVIIILADTGNMPRFIRVLYDFPNGDKAGHFMLFGFLNYLLARGALASFPRRSPVRIIITASLILAGIVAAEEYSQNYFAHRAADWLDLAASFLGMIAGGFAAFKFRPRS
jgi:polysaccharide biosynthesis protein VpsQ